MSTNRLPSATTMAPEPIQPPTPALPIAPLWLTDSASSKPESQFKRILPHADRVEKPMTFRPSTVAATVHRNPWRPTMNAWIGGVKRCLTQPAVAIPALRWRLRAERDTPFTSDPIFGCNHLRCNRRVTATENRPAVTFSNRINPITRPHV